MKEDFYNQCFEYHLYGLQALLIKYNPENKITFLHKKFKKLNYKNINQINLHTQEISNISAIIAKKNSIRKILKNFQIAFVKKNKNCCIEERDI